MQPIKNIVQLRQFLAEQLPNLRASLPVVRLARDEPGDSTQLDNLLAGAKSFVTEVVSTTPSSGSALLIQWILRRTLDAGQWLVLVDGQDCFDPTSVEQEVLSRVLWVRCRDAAQALKAADILVRDDNLPIVILDLQLTPKGQLRKIPATVWYRFQRLIEHHAASLLVFTPQPLVSSARSRVFLRNHFALDALHKPDEELFAQFSIEVRRLDGKEIKAVSELAVKTG